MLLRHEFVNRDVVLVEKCNKTVAWQAVIIPILLSQNARWKNW